MTALAEVSEKRERERKKTLLFICHSLFARNQCKLEHEFGQLSLNWG